MISEGQPPGLLTKQKGKKEKEEDDKGREGETPLLNPRVLGGRCLYSGTTNSRDHQHSDEGQVSLMPSERDAATDLDIWQGRQDITVTCHMAAQPAESHRQSGGRTPRGAPSRRGVASANRMTWLEGIEPVPLRQTPLPASSGRTIVDADVYASWPRRCMGAFIGLNHRTMTLPTVRWGGPD